MKKVKRFFKSLTLIEFISLIIMSIIIILLLKFLFIGEPYTSKTAYSDYTCSGGFIKMCSGYSEIDN